METVRTNALVLLGEEMTGAHGEASTKAAIAEFLWTLPWLKPEITGDWAALSEARLRGCDVLIQYSGGRRHECTAEQATAVRQFVENGGGYVPLHFTTANANPDFLKLVGAAFINHPPFGPFTVRVSDPAHPITQGLGPIELDDECYRSDVFDRSAIHVIATSHHPDSDAKIDGEPSAWVREVGKGRIFYSALGHNNTVWSRPAVRDLVARGIRWAARLEPVAPPAAGQ
jgi:uncharacterized protein